MSLSPQLWTALSPLLDELLMLPASARPERVAALAARDPALARELQALLNEQRQVTADGFLDDERMPARPIASAGQVVGSYTLMAPLGEGGMGTVWRARRSDGRFDAEVAVKFLSTAVIEASGLARFRREGSLLAALRHPNIAHLIDAGIGPAGQPFLVLEYVDGVRIDRYCDEHALDAAARLKLFCDVLGAVSEAHRQLIVHGDLKPSNVLVRRDGVVKLLDFGVAHLVDEQVDADVPPEPARGFTPDYAAPEQLEGGALTTATDVYGVGALLLELLTGAPPTRGEASPFPSRHLSAGFERFGPALQGDVDEIVAKCLRTDPRSRYRSVADIAADLLRHFAYQPVTVRRATPGYVMGRFVRRHRVSVAAAVAVALALLATTAIALYEEHQAGLRRDEAQRELRFARAANDFVTSLLSQAGPARGGLTPVELIDRGIDAIRLRYADDPEFSIQMLLVLSGRYMDMDRTDKELTTLEEAETLARRSRKPAVLTDVLCDMVETEEALGERAAATAKIQEIRALLQTTQVPPLVEANCLRQEAAFARGEDRIDDGIGYLERAKQILEANDITYGNVYSSHFSWLYTFEYLAGHFTAAHRYHEEDLALVARDKRGGTVAGKLARVSMAKSWSDLGETRRGLALLETSTAPADYALHPMIEIYRGEMLSTLGQHTPGLAAIERGIAQARERGAVDFVARGELARARALLQADRIDAAWHALRELAPDLDRATDRRLRHAFALEIEAGIDLASKQFADADRAATRALSELGYPDRPRGSHAAAALTLRSRIRTAEGRSRDGIADAHVAVELLGSDVLDARASATLGAARLALAQAERGAGERAQAQADAALAVIALGNGLGSEHPLTQQARALLVRP